MEPVLPSVWSAYLYSLVERNMMEDLNSIFKHKQQARMLRQLVEEHKKNCDGENCGIILYLFAEIYQGLVGRELTVEEFGSFM